MIDETLQALPSEEQKLKELLNAYIVVAKARLGRVPTATELLEMIVSDGKAKETDSSPAGPSSEEADKLSKNDESGEEGSKDEGEEVAYGGDEAEKEDKGDKGDKEGEGGEGDVEGGHKGDEEKDEEKGSHPKILDTKVYYGMKDGKLDPDSILFYRTADDRYYSVKDQEWLDEKPSIIDHLHSRPLEFREKDIIAAMMNSIIDDDDYAALHDAGMINDTLQKLWDLLSKLQRQYMLLDGVGQDFEQPHDGDEGGLVDKLDEIIDALSGGDKP